MGRVTTIPSNQSNVFYGFAALALLCTALALYADIPALAVLPAALIGLALVVSDFRVLYYGFFALLPFSTEVEFGSLGTDLPSEPMMLVLTGIGIVLFLRNFKNIPRRVIYHPITALLVFHVLWIFIAAIFSQNQVFSFKFFLAKLWYVIPFYFMGYYMLREDSDVLQVYKLSALFLTLAVCIVLFRHARLGFTFDTSNEVVYPIFRNHVSYAAMIVAVLPYLWAIWRTEQKSWLLVPMGILIAGTYFSYTRAAHLCIFIMIGGYFIFKYKLGKYALALSFVLGMLVVYLLVDENRYLNFAPDFSKTISHDKFDNLVEATYKLEDISTMERVYRWVAGGHMVGEKPLIGYGPNSFYHNYTKFTISSFETYVSDNPEKSGIHCYYLMTAVEQGVIGLFIFLSLCFTIILIGERTFHKVDSLHGKYIVMAALLSNLGIFSLLIMNDLIETDKVGPFFFLNLCIISFYSLNNEPS